MYHEIIRQQTGKQAKHFVLGKTEQDQIQDKDAKVLNPAKLKYLSPIPNYVKEELIGFQRDLLASISLANLRKIKTNDEEMIDSNTNKWKI